MDENDVDSSWEGFLDLFEAAVKDSIPSKTGRTKPKSSWVDDDIKKLIRKKNKAYCPIGEINETFYDIYMLIIYRV